MSCRMSDWRSNHGAGQLEGTPVGVVRMMRPVAEMTRSRARRSLANAAEVEQTRTVPAWNAPLNSLLAPSAVKEI